MGNLLADKPIIYLSVIRADEGTIRAGEEISKAGQDF